MTCARPIKIPGRPDGRLAGQGRPTLRVLHVLPSLAGGGMERALARLMAATGGRSTGIAGPLQHGVCILRSAEPAMLAAYRPLARVWSLHRSGARRADLWACWWRLRRVIRQFRPDVVQARATACWFDAAMALQGMEGPRLALSFHGLEDTRPIRFRRLLMNRWSARQAEAVVAVSHQSADMMRREWGLAADKLSVLHNGVDTDHFYPGELHERRAARACLGLPAQARVVMCMANLVPIKAVDVLLRAWTQVRRQDPEARLLIAGNGPSRESLVLLAAELGHGAGVNFLGHVPQVAGVLRAADVFVLPSRYEACSNAILEAMATGLPVIACRVGGNRELVDQDRIGLLVEPDEPGGLGRAILRALRDQCWRSEAGAAARDRAVTHFRLRDQTEAYTRFCHSLAAGAASTAPLREAASCAG